MKKTLLYFIITVKTLSAYFIIALLFALATSSCQTDEMAPMLPGGSRPIDGKVPVPVPSSIPPSEVLRTDFPGATKWRITFDSPNKAHEWSYQRFLSTKTGTFMTLEELNQSPKNTSLAHIDFLFGRVHSPIKFWSKLTHNEHIADVAFKPSNMSMVELFQIASTAPELLQSKYEHSPYEGTMFQPYNYEADGDESDFYKNDDAFLFKIEDNPARYGVVYIVETSPFFEPTPRIVEVVVQAENL